MSKRVVIVDDSIYMRTLIKDSLSGDSFEVAGHASTGESAIELINDVKPDLIIMDNILPDMLGLDVITLLKKKNIESKVILISAAGQHTLIEEAQKAGAASYLVKPFTPEKLKETINKVIST